MTKLEAETKLNSMTEREIGRIDLLESFAGTSSPIRPHHAEWPKPPSFLALVFFDGKSSGDTWESIGSTRVDVRKKVFLDDLPEGVGIRREELNVRFGEEVARIVGAAMSPYVVVFRQEGQK